MLVALVNNDGMFSLNQKGKKKEGLEFDKSLIKSTVQNIKSAKEFRNINPRARFAKECRLTGERYKAKFC